MASHDSLKNGPPAVMSDILY